MQDLMRLRMVPFEELSERLHRVVRQCAKDLGKRAELELRGAQVEVDRSVLERITAPLEHMLRNARRGARSASRSRRRATNCCLSSPTMARG
jgi:chemosensory pili system protein ChpA (sensor histidine kinase/response regulator)